MLKRIQENYHEGVGKLRWFSGMVSERMKVEMAVIRLLYRSEEMERSREKILSRIGERVAECRDKPERNLYRDSVIAEALAELDGLDKEIHEVRSRASEISKAS